MSSNFFEVNDLLKGFGIQPLNIEQIGFGNNPAINLADKAPVSKPISIPQTQQKAYEFNTPKADYSSPYFQVGNINLGKDGKVRAESSNKYQPTSHGTSKFADDLSAKYKYNPAPVPTQTKDSLVYNPNKLSNLGTNLQYPATKLSNIGLGSHSNTALPNYTKDSYLNAKSPSNISRPSDSYLQPSNFAKYDTTSPLNTPNIPLVQQPSYNQDVNRIIADIKRNSGSSTGPNTPIQKDYSSPSSVPTPYNQYTGAGYSSNPISPHIQNDISPLNIKEPIKKPVDNLPYNVSSPYSNPSNVSNLPNPNKASNFSNFNNNYNYNQTPVTTNVNNNNMLNSSLLKSYISPFQSQHSKVNRPRLDQKYQSALKICMQTNSEFNDYEFPASEKSIAPPQNLNEYRSIKTWVRPRVIWGKEEFELYFKIIEPNDIQQGYLGDCAFLSTIAAIAETPSRIQRIFINESKSKYGLYGLNLVWKGVPVEVIVDDLIPVDSRNKPYFQQSKEKELWAFLIEKAWAKLHKNYHQLNGQLVKESMHDLTGAPVRNFDPRNCDPKVLWEKILKAKSQDLNRIICAGTLGEDTGDDNDPLKKHGLISGHAYSLIGAYEITLKSGYKEKLVKMRNPWGNFEWNKTYADKDYQWQNVTEEDKRRMEYLNEDDGTFFMKFDTFRQYYDSVDICYYYDDYNYFGVKCRSKCNEAKYFRVDLKKDAYCFFFVSQLSIRCFDEDYQFVNPKDQGHYSETKICVADSNGNIIHKIKGKKRDLFSPKYVDNEDRQRFKAGTYYVFVQVQWQRGATHSFGVGCYTKEADIKQVTQYDAKCLTSFTDKWSTQELYDNDIEKVYGRV
ncbi:calpain family cysteine protease (macronuclear) [Tetrahymena thermophila SB210]|uniref:Calpain family cysteine protease n=1 Tax=Tetrahymena thermophila (strain SB210) TaxID=312017 RepID=Q23D00_TETTS|nr:calpain family cysteine protease [Tetrahymena thermophila SB210]EAR94557.3 calpain family cysteine protease [Tetrahymena thermophila SB210]|eukprot:XP_001014886.3 calpain family cysteine protease [Tetrahymena thermophila SB210]